MGLLYTAAACTGCGYQPATLLRYHSGALGLYLGLATCRACEEIAPYFPSREQIPDEDARAMGIEAPHRYHARVQNIAAGRADVYPQGIPLDTCLLCGSTRLSPHHLREPQYDHGDGLALPCPRCIAGRLRLHPAGMWD
ncbi:MAG: hypothetical protein MUE40_03650 [Anaerolineae bacterium]|jgi:hypothetical protein|nr:hypothetical protein [Anaerolineae bacterium]